MAKSVFHADTNLRISHIWQLGYPKPLNIHPNIDIKLLIAHEIAVVYRLIQSLTAAFCESSEAENLMNWESNVFPAWETCSRFSESTRRDSTIFTEQRHYYASERDVGGIVGYIPTLLV